MSKQESSKLKDKSKINSINFHEIIKIEEEENDDEIKFTLQKRNIIKIKKSECIQFVDPSYDSVFKEIFGEGNVCNEKNGNDRLLNLLNSLIFPQQEDKYFTKVTSVINEKGKISKGNKNSGILRFDISCKATLFDNKKKRNKIINIEMQLGKKTGLINRMINYAQSLYNIYKTETILIAFMNQDYINDDNDSLYTKHTIYKSRGEKIKDIDNYKVIIVNLKKEISKHINNEQIYINKKELDLTGICWLKLLGIRQWGKAFNNFYCLPKNVSFPSDEMKSAFILLQKYNEMELLGFMRTEEEDNNLAITYKEEGKKEQILLSLIKIYKEKKEMFDILIDIIDFEKTTFKSEDIEALIKDNSEKQNFSEMLGKKRKIE